MAANFRRHDVTAQNLSEPDREAYARERAALIAAKADQDEVDTKLNVFFWQCFEADEEDEGD